MNNFTIDENFSYYMKCFREENSKLNLISKNDEKFLFEKHIFDSLAIKLFFEKYNIKKADILDIGCGGGFPCVPIAIEYPEMSVTGIDSIQKKINAVNNLKQKLELKNLELICDRVENVKNREFDIIVSRAVADLSVIVSYAIPLLKKSGYFIAYKSKKSAEEIEKSKQTLQNLKVSVIDNLEYRLPLEELYDRNLIVIKRNS